MASTVTLHIGDVRDVMARLPDNGFDFIVTSPPFLALRSYLPSSHPDKHREIGSEPTPAAFLDTLFGLSEDWGRLLPVWGSVAVELGDTMSGAVGWTQDDPKWRNRDQFRTTGRSGPGWPLAKSMCLLPHLYTIGLAYGHNPLTGQPHGAGQWRIRNVITWARPNPPVGSLGKRNPEKRTGDYKFRPACSFITVACRGTGRYFDLDAVRTDDARAPSVRAPEPKALELQANGHHGVGMPATGTYHANGGAPPLDWHTDQLDGDWLWKLATAPYAGAHYATYPLTLPRRLIQAMCPARVCRECGWPSERVSTVEYEATANRRPTSKANGAVAEGVSQGHHAHRLTNPTADRTTLGWTDCRCPCSIHEIAACTICHNRRTGHVLDPFGGSGTTAVAAAIEHRDATLIDLDPRNVDLVRRRLTDHCRILDEHHDGDTITWTVEPVSRPELDAIAAGQMELFE
jgi:site-specific DNA-methyltransferase (cytosine-N4-specific)